MTEWLSLGAALALIGWATWTVLRKGGEEQHRPAVDDPRQPYTVYSRTHDVICGGVEVSRYLDSQHSGHYPGNAAWRTFVERLEIAEVAYASAHTAAENGVVPQPPRLPATIAILFDQSGSMADRIPTLAGQLRAICERIEDAGFSVGLFGHTTRGWQGGSSRRDWLAAGSPLRPGRLADVLHITYKDFDAPLEPKNWQAMLLPDALHENIDGEALEWVAKLLMRRCEGQKHLIMISDGASVDDSTLLENGPGFLERHLRQVIAKIDDQEAINLSAIGIGHRVDEYYQHARNIYEVEELPEAILSVIADQVESQRTD